jgi:hypothetical protein
MEAVPSRRVAVGVDAHDGVGTHGVGHRSALVHAWPDRGVVVARQRCAHTQLVQLIPDPQHYMVLQYLVPPRPLGTCRVIEESLTPLWPGPGKRSSRPDRRPRPLARRARRPVGRGSAEPARHRHFAQPRACQQIDAARAHMADPAPRKDNKAEHT